MAKQTLLPKMETKSYNEVMGTLDLGLRENKLTVIFGSPGTGKSSALAEFASLHSNAHMILCSPTMNMKNLLVAIARCINTHVKGDPYTVQQQVTEALVNDPNHILLFDECENLHRGDVSKIDVLRQIYDVSDVNMVLCGTHKLHSLLSGANDHNQPQIFRRLLKAEFGVTTKQEVTDYLDQLENLLHIRFTSDARNELFTLCTDVENGGLGIFIAMLELMFSIIRPEWKEICRSAKKNTDPSIDVDVLESKVIDRNTIRQASKFKMTK